MFKLYESRSKCIFCDTVITKTYFEKDYFLHITSVICNKENNKKLKIPYNILICEYCGSYQNKYLGDLKLVYSDNHNNLNISKIWKKHYDNLFNFFEKNIKIDKESKIIEIGAGNNYIANLFLTNNYNNYTILEPVITNKIDGIKYIDGWLENYISDQQYDLTILSHVFEHLYKPNELFKIKSKYILISIPNIPKYIENLTLNFLNIEHTFYYEEEHIEIFFNNNNYKLISKDYFDFHSIYMLFEYDEFIVKKNYDCSKIIKINNKFNICFQKITDMVKKINEYTKQNNKNFVIFPANLYIQFLICMGLDISNIKYLYDNNINKKDKYLYGTELICKDLNFFIENNNYEIILFGFLYNEEIINLLVKNNIKYYSINL